MVVTFVPIVIDFRKMLCPRNIVLMLKRNINANVRNFHILLVFPWEKHFNTRTVHPDPSFRWWIRSTLSIKLDAMFKLFKLWHLIFVFGWNRGRNEEIHSIPYHHPCLLHELSLFQFHHIRRFLHSGNIGSLSVIKIEK